MKKSGRKSRVVICECVTLHTYPAFMHAYPVEVMIHLCRCGQEHMLDNLIPPPAKAPPRKRRRSS